MRMGLSDEAADRYLDQCEALLAATERLWPGEPDFFADDHTQHFDAATAELVRMRETLGYEVSPNELLAALVDLVQQAESVDGTAQMNLDRAQAAILAHARVTPSGAPIGGDSLAAASAPESPAKPNPSRP